MNTATRNPKTTKLVFVTGGVCSSLGKGILAASLGRLLSDRGLVVANAKLDPYLNVDPGTMAPSEHGECWVTPDGAECDLDLGHYERFTGVASTKHRSVTAGQVYWSVLSAERRGDMLGATVQAIPHVTDGIIERIDAMMVGNDGVAADVLIVEVGGTVGDIEIQVFLEAIRQLRTDRHGDVANVHLTLVPEVGPSRELKTKPSQHSVAMLRSFGFSPDVLVARSSAPLEPALLAKLARSCGVKAVVGAPDVTSIYAVPANLANSGLDSSVCAVLGIVATERDSSRWNADTRLLIEPPGDPLLKIGVVAKYISGHDTYISVVEACQHAAAAAGVGIDLVWVDAEELEHSGTGQLGDMDGVIVPGGFGGRGVEGKVAAAGWAKRTRVPYLGLCLGLQVAVIESARAAGVSGASSLEWGQSGPQVITLLADQVDVTEKGGTMRLGEWPARLEGGSMLARAYGCPDGGVVMERHRHRYEVNPRFLDAVEADGLFVVGVSPDGTLVEHVERRDHPCFIATQAHPEFGSRPGRPHPMFAAFIAASVQRNQQRHTG